MRRDEIAKLLIIITSAYPGVKIPEREMTIKAWDYLLGDLTYSLAEKSLLRVMKLQEIPAMPTPGAIRKEALNLIAEIPTEAEALAEFRKALSRHGRNYNKVMAEIHPASKMVIDAIDFYVFCDSSPGINNSLFTKLYKAQAEVITKRLRLTEIGNGQGLKDPERFKALTSGIGKIK